MQKNARHGMDRKIVAMRWTRPGDPSEVDRGAVMHEGQRNELGEPTGLVLNAGQEAKVSNPMRGVVDVAVHHRRRRSNSLAMRSRHDLDPT